MNKKVLSLAILVGLFGFCGLVFSASMSAPTLIKPLLADNFCQLLTNITSGVGMLIASLGAIMIIIAGIFYLTSAGNPERIGVAKKTLIYAIVGIAIGISASVIVATIKWVLNASGADC